jgi:hypothetical protein
MGLYDLPILGATQGVTTIVTTSSVSRVTVVEEAILLTCIALLVAALLRHGPRRIHLLLWGFAILPARDVFVHTSITFGIRPSGMWAGNLANSLTFVGWLLIAGYCLTLALKPSIGSSPDSRTSLRQDQSES